MVNRIAVNPTNPSQIIAATLSGLSRSNDNGVTWTAVHLTGNMAALNTSMATDVKWSNDGNNVIASFGGTVVYSNNGGTTWAQEGSTTNAGYPTGASERVELAIAPSNSNVIYALMCASNGGTKGVYKSSDGGKTWNTVAYLKKVHLVLEARAVTTIPSRFRPLTLTNFIWAG